MPVIRTLSPPDLPALLRLSEAASWNQTRDDWVRLLALGKGWGIEEEGLLAASATVAVYGSDLAWIGMVLTLPDFRGRGFARHLMEHSIEYLRDASVRCIKLDASDMGRPLYAALGFNDERIVERWRRPAGQLPAIVLPRVEPDDWRQWDAAAFGADRTALLESLSRIESAAVEAGGYAFSRAGRVAHFIGPCVAGDAETAERLASALISQHPTADFFWDLDPDTEAAKIARRLGFEPARRLWRMWLGEPSEAGFSDSVYGLAGFEWG
jgi:GNAT superfamily N-acetyltransferase